MPVAATIGIVLGAVFYQPLSAQEVDRWHRDRANPPALVARLAAFLAAADLEIAGKPEEALATLIPHRNGDDPLAVAIQFHRERLALTLRKPTGEGLRELFAGVSDPSPQLRWGINREDEARALELLAAHLESAGGKDEAEAIRHHLAVEYPRWAPASASLSWAARRVRATNLVRDMDYKSGLAALRALLVDAPDSEVLAVKRQIGQVIAEKVRDGYPEAAALYREIIADPKSNAGDQLFLAYIFGKYDPDASVATYRSFVERFPAHPQRDEADFFRIWDAVDRERFTEAVEGLSAFIRAYPASAYLHAAHWYRGLCLYRLGRFAAALPDLEHTEQLGRERDKGAYWTARVLHLLGRTEDAKIRWLTLARQKPLSFYGILARSRLATEHQPPLWVDESEAPPVVPSEKAAAAAFAALPSMRRQRLREALAVAQLGYLDLAQQLFAHLERGGGLRGELLELLRPVVGDYARLIKSAPAMSCRRFLRTAPRHPAVRQCWLWQYPLAYRPLIDEVRGDLPAEIFWAIMRQESLYDPRARSTADALGLVQIIPQVGQPAATELGLPFSPYRLYRPEVSLTLFSRAMGAIYERFNGHVPLILMAYNSTPEMAEKWLRENRELPFDLFVEEISYKETRDYVKRVTSHLAHYRTLTADPVAPEDLLARAGLPPPDTLAGTAFALR